MTYKILTGTTGNKLEDLVNKSFSVGWQLQGGDAITTIGAKTIFQAVIKV